MDSYSAQIMNLAGWRRKVLRDRDAIMRDIQRYYPITSITDVPANSWNALFLGCGKGRQYCIKVFNEETGGIKRSREDLTYVARVMHTLESAGFHYVVPPVRSAAGDYAHVCGGYWITVFPWVTYSQRFALNEEKAQSPEVATRAAQLLAEMHSCIRGCAERVHTPRLRDLAHAYKPSIWVARADALWTTAEQNLRKRGASIDCQVKLHAARECGRQIIEENPSFFSDCKEHEIIVHGDFRPENILLGSQGCWIVLDFDLCHESYLELDVAIGALSFAGPRRLIGQRDWSVCSSFVKAYVDASESPQFSWHWLDIALRWTMLKALSLSFKEEQVEGRVKLYHETLENLPFLREQFS